MGRPNAKVDHRALSDERLRLLRRLAFRHGGWDLYRAWRKGFRDPAQASQLARELFGRAGDERTRAMQGQSRTTIFLRDAPGSALSAAATVDTEKTCSGTVEFFDGFKPIDGDKLHGR